MPEKTAIQKMLVKPGQHLALLNALSDFAARLGELPAGASLVAAAAADLAAVSGIDVILLLIRDRSEMESWLPAVKARLAPGTIFWIAYPKGRGSTTGVNRDLINTFAGGFGLQGVAMIALDETWSALRLKMI